MTTSQSSATQLVDDVKSGKEYTICFSDIPPLPEKNVAVYNLAILALLRKAFTIVAHARQAQPTWIDVVPMLIAKETIQESLDAIVRKKWPNTLRADFEEIYQLPIFERSLKHTTSRHGQPGGQYFRDIVREMQSVPSSVAVVIVRSTESILCFKVFSPEDDLFVIFNPRPSPGHPGGMGMTFSQSAEQVVQRLCSLVCTDNPSLPNPDGSLHWQARLLSKCITYGFVPRASDDTSRKWEDAIVYPSLVLLKLQAEHGELQRENNALLKNHESLERRVSELQHVLQAEKEKAARKPLEQRPNMPTASHLPRSPARRMDFPSTPTIEQRPNVPTASRSPRSLMRETGVEIDPMSIPEDIDPNLAYALRLQREFDREDRELIAERNTLKKSAQRQYHCDICLEDFPEDDLIRIDSCGHEICRDCARGHVCSKIEQHRFPVLCPVCTAQQGNLISGLVVQLIGVSEEQYTVWVEMEMAQFSVLVHCRKCASTLSFWPAELTPVADASSPHSSTGTTWKRLTSHSALSSAATTCGAGSVSNPS
ncbi:hypothetical protein ID866_5055 [Astraeus odoratus]|nr:hypothetical protein ID866_5055 [Astraeus odoratus]